MAKEKPKDTLGKDILDALMRIGAGVITGGGSELAQIPRPPDFSMTGGGSWGGPSPFMPGQWPREIAPVSPRSRLEPVDAPGNIYDVPYEDDPALQYEAPFVGPPTWREQGKPNYSNRYNRPPPYIDPSTPSPIGPAGIEHSIALDQARIEAAKGAHPAGGYYGGSAPGEDFRRRYGGDQPTPEGSRGWMPGFQQTPLMYSDEFYPPPTISAEDQEEMDRRENLIRAITESLKETVKTENRAAKKKGKK